MKNYKHGWKTQSKRTMFWPIIAILVALMFSMMNPMPTTQPLTFYDRNS